jgi:hypothetical protein
MLNISSIYAQYMLHTFTKHPLLIDKIGKAPRVVVATLRMGYVRIEAEWARTKPPMPEPQTRGGTWRDYTTKEKEIPLLYVMNPKS